MQAKQKVELLPSVEEIRAIVRRKKQGIAAPGAEKRRMHELWVSQIMKEEAEAKKRIIEDEDFETEVAI